jgi:hypothetical protein
MEEPKQIQNVIDMKKTIIYIWVFANEVEIIQNDDHYWTIDEATAWAVKNTWHSAIVMKVIQFWPGGELAIHNEKWKPFTPGTRDLSQFKKDPVK